jgi:hypothetical protein
MKLHSNPLFEVKFIILGEIFSVLSNYQHALVTFFNEIQQ